MKPIWIVLISVIVAGGLAGGGTYYYLDKQAKTDKADLQVQIDDLSAKLNAKTEELAVANSSISTGTAATTSTDETAGWKTYTNSNHGYSFKYPTDWILTEHEDNSISAMSPETKASIDKAVAAGQIYNYGGDMWFKYYSSVAEEAENKANNYGATTLDQLIDRDPMIEKIGNYTLGGISGYDVGRAGYGTYYSILVVRNGHLFEVYFENINTKADVTATEKKILGTYRFTD